MFILKHLVLDFTKTSFLGEFVCCGGGWLGEGGRVGKGGG